MPKSRSVSVQEPWQSASSSITDLPTGRNPNFDEEAPQSAFSICEPPADLSTLTTHLTGHSTYEAFPDGGLRSWSVVVGSFFLLMATFGVMNTTGILQNYFASHQLSHYSPSAVGWIPGLFTFFGLSLSVQVGPMFDRYGPTYILIAGTACYITGLMLLAESHLYWHFVLTLGVLSGTGTAFLSTVALASVPQWFDRKAGLAIGISMAGAGLGGVIFPFMLRSGFTRLGYRWTIRLLALVVLIMCVIGIALVKARLPKGRSKSTVNLRSLQDARFTWLTMGIFGEFAENQRRISVIADCELGLELEVFAGLGLYPTYVVMQGFSNNDSVILLAVLNV
jgi:MFS family permease